MHVGVVLLQKPLHFIITELVPGLESAVLLSVLLDRIIGQMNVFVAQMSLRVEERRGTNVAIFVVEALEPPIDRSQHGVAPDVEFTLEH